MNRQQTLHFRLLGPPLVQLDGDPLSDWGPGKAQAIAYYLAVMQKPVPRDELSALLWPEADRRKALRYLSDHLVFLRRHMKHFLLASAQTVALAASPSVVVDLHQVTDQLQGAAASAQGSARLRQVVAHYRGPFLEGFGVLKAPAFEQWIDETRDEVAGQMADALFLLAQSAVDAEDDQQATSDLDQLLQLIPWYEPAHRLMMALLAKEKRYGAAMEQYRLCRARLAEALDVVPDQETEELLAQIRGEAVAVESAKPSAFSLATGQIESEQVESEQVESAQPAAVEVGQQVSASTQPRVVGAAMSETAKPGEPLDKQVPFAPAPLRPLIGRDTLLAGVMERLQDPGHRLITLLGMGGVGKSHAALTIGQMATAHFPHGICFVGLDGIPPASVHAQEGDKAGAKQRIALAMATALKLSPGSSQELLEQLTDYLRQRQVLFILDNFEHLLGATAFLQELLGAAPSCKCLVTSRVRLHLSGESVVGVHSLPVPSAAKLEAAMARILEPNHIQQADYAQYASLQLFIDSAHRHNDQFSLMAAEMEAIRQICALTGGLPLALEMVAGWTAHFSLDEIVARLQADEELLVQDSAVEPARHQALDALFNQSWALLVPDEQDALLRLSHFATAFDQTAAAAVLQAAPPLLRRLTEQTFLRAKTVGRYELHPLLQRFLQAKWQAQFRPESPETVAFWHAYCSYYLGFLVDHAAQLDSGSSPEAWARIQAEYAHIYEACLQAVRTGRFDLLQKSLDAMKQFYLRRSALQEALAFFQTVRTELTRASTSIQDDAERDGLLVHFDVVTLETQVGMDYFDGVLQQAQAAKAQLDKAATPDLRIRYHLAAAIALEAAGKVQEAHQHYILVDEQLSDEMPMALQAHYHRNYACYLSANGQIDEAIKHNALSLEAYRQAGDIWHEADILLETATSHHRHGQYSAENVANAQQALALYRQQQNRLGEANALNDLGFISMGSVSASQRLQYLEAAYAIYRDLGTESGICYAAGNLTHQYLCVGQYALAQTLLAAMAETRAAKININSRFLMLVYMSIAARVQGEPEEALRLAQALDKLGGEVREYHQEIKT